MTLMIEVAAVQVGRAGASPQLSVLKPDSPGAAAPERKAVPATSPGLVSPPGLIDRDGLLSAQEGGSEEDRQRRKDPAGLTDEERSKVQEMKARDREVRAHEQAHAGAGGQYAGAPSYSYENGPDGKRYAVSGEVSIDVSPVEGDPEATIRKMEQVKKAALAPADPSAQDRKVAAQADATKAKARAERTQERAREQQEANAEVPSGEQGRALSGPGGYRGAANANHVLNLVV